MGSVARWCAAAIGLVAGCGTSGTPVAGDRAPVEAPPDPPPAAGVDAGPRVTSHEELAEIPSMPISQLLGKTRAEIETLFYPSQAGHAAAWVRYNPHLEVRYEEERCVELIQLVRDGLTCRDAARWIGFGAAMAPIHRAGSCVWPPGSLKHSLGAGVSGELLLEGGTFRARLDR